MTHPDSLPSHTRRGDALARWTPPAALMIALLVIYWPLLLPGWTLAGADFLQLFYPLKQFSMESWAAGRAPLWNPHSFLGAPFLASMQPAALYPPDIFLLALRGDLLWAMKAQLFLHLCALAMGCYWLYRVGAGGERWGAALAALAVAGGAFMRFHLEHINQVAALAWAPWIVGVAWMALARGRRMALLAMPALVALQILAGHPQHVYNTMLVLGGLGAFALAAGPDRRRAALTILLMALGVVGGLALAAPQLLPAIELAALSPRSGQSVAEALTFSLPPERLLSFILPRQGLTFDNAPAYSNIYGEFGCYIGLIPLMLAAVGLGAAIVWTRLGPETTGLMRPASAGGEARWRWMWPLGAAVCLVLALGSHAPVYGPLASVLPGMAGFRVPARWLFFTALFLGGGAQFGWALVCGRAVRRRDLKYLSRPGWAGFLTFILVAVDLQVMPPPGPMDRQLQRSMIEITLDSARRLGQSLVTRGPRAGEGRLYRMERFDADHSMNNLPEGVRERLLRLQPETHMLTGGPPALFGYEQALLPTRDQLTLQAHYNRNLRWRDPDAQLLALLGVRWIMSDYEISGRDWRPLPLRGESALGARPMMFFENRRWRGEAFSDQALAGPVDWEGLAPASSAGQPLGQSQKFDYAADPAALFLFDERTSGVPEIVLRPAAGGHYSGRVARNAPGAGPLTIVWSQMARPGWAAHFESGNAQFKEPLQQLGPFHLTFALPADCVDFELTYTPQWWHESICSLIISLIFYLVLAVALVRKSRSRRSCAGGK